MGKFNADFKLSELYFNTVYDTRHYWGDGECLNCVEQPNLKTFCENNAGKKG